jgi:hypothetical protein
MNIFNTTLVRKYAFKYESRFDPKPYSEELKYRLAGYGVEDQVILTDTPNNDNGWFFWRGTNTHKVCRIVRIDVDNQTVLISPAKAEYRNVSPSQIRRATEKEITEDLKLRVDETIQIERRRRGTSRI